MLVTSAQSERGTKPSAHPACGPEVTGLESYQVTEIYMREADILLQSDSVSVNQMQRAIYLAAALRCRAYMARTCVQTKLAALPNFGLDSRMGEDIRHGNPGAVKLAYWGCAAAAAEAICPCYDTFLGHAEEPPPPATTEAG